MFILAFLLTTIVLAINLRRGTREYYKNRFSTNLKSYASLNEVKLSLVDEIQAPLQALDGAAVRGYLDQAMQKLGRKSEEFKIKTMYH